MSSARGSQYGAGRAMPATRGVVYMHCVPSAIAPHVEWALAGGLGTPG
jgi:hypothetical protein